MNSDQHTINEEFINVGNGHSIYVQDWGNSKAQIPIIFLHGGPGAGCNDGHKQLFNPSKQRVIFFDQRGSGKSLPSGQLDHNTTDDLIEDIETIADHLKIKNLSLLVDRGVHV